MRRRTHGTLKLTREFAGSRSRLKPVKPIPVKEVPRAFPTEANYVVESEILAKILHYCTFVIGSRARDARIPFTFGKHRVNCDSPKWLFRVVFQFDLNENGNWIEKCTTLDVKMYSRRDALIRSFA